MFFAPFYLALQLGGRIKGFMLNIAVTVGTIASKAHGDFIQWLFTLGHFWIGKRFFGVFFHVNTLLLSNTFLNEKEFLTRRYQPLFF